MHPSDVGPGAPGEVTALSDRLLAALGVRRGSVRVRIHEPSGPPTAWCEPGAVHIRPPAVAAGFWDEAGLGRLMLAHEAVHAAQFQAALRTAPVALLEIEADELAPRLLAGQACRVRLGASPRRLHWGRAGHYYTLYLASLVAGADDYTAQRMAFYGQIPDLVSEFDAPTQVAIRLRALDMPLDTAVNLYVRNKRGVTPDDPEVCCDVIEGLHCLTGRPASEEQSRRTQILMGAGWGGLEFGIALHALGDAWAHTDGGVMFGHDYGHARKGHSPDSINSNQQKYKDYYNALLFVLRANIPCRVAPGSPSAATADMVASALDSMAMSMADGEAEKQQIPFLRSLIGAVSSGKSSNYAPADDPVPWAEFVGKGGAGNAIPNPDGAFRQIMALAAKWRVTPRDTRPLQVRMAEVDAKRQNETNAMMRTMP